MAEYNFWLIYSDPSTEQFPSFAVVHAEGYEQAVQRFTDNNGFTVDAISTNEIWIGKGKVSAKYLVTRR